MDSPTIRIGKGKDQVIINSNNQIEEISKGYSESVHDKQLFLKEYELINDKIDKTLHILGDKAYIGLEEYKVKTPTKSNVNNSTSRVKLEYKKDKVVAKEKNKNLSSKRIKVEQLYLLSYNAHICLHEKL